MSHKEPQHKHIHHITSGYGKVALLLRSSRSTHPGGMQFNDCTAHTLRTSGHESLVPQVQIETVFEGSKFH